MLRPPHYFLKVATYKSFSGRSFALCCGCRTGIRHIIIIWFCHRVIRWTIIRTKQTINPNSLIMFPHMHERRLFYQIFFMPTVYDMGIVRRVANWFSAYTHGNLSPVEIKLKLSSQPRSAFVNHCLSTFIVMTSCLCPSVLMSIQT